MSELQTYLREGGVLHVADAPSDLSEGDLAKRYLETRELRRKFAPAIDRIVGAAHEADMRSARIRRQWRMRWLRQRVYEALLVATGMLIGFAICYQLQL